jgi:hypothetical protein
MLADIAILASIGDNLPLISAWIDAFQSELALDDETLRLINRHVECVGQHEHIFLRQDSFLSNGLPEMR